MRLELPKLMECPRCGQERKVATTGNTLLLGEIIVTFVVGPCELCDLLEAQK